MTTQAQTRAAGFRLPGVTLFSALRLLKPADMPNQIVAGITLAALMIPLNIGYAQVAGLPPIVGLYSSIVPMILWGLCATSRNLVAGPDAPVAALIGSLLDDRFPLSKSSRVQDIVGAYRLLRKNILFGL
jgi:MFS superfamily sulfate permease-like transporter